MKNKIIFWTFFAVLPIFFFGCVKKSDLLKEKKEKQSEFSVSKDRKELDFIVENNTGKTIYIACFSYIKRKEFDRWRWDKSAVYKLDKNKKTLVDIDTIEDKENRKHVYGALAIFETKKEALESTYELLKEKNRIDLDRLYKLKNKIVKIGIEKYGFKGNLLDIEIIPQKNTITKYPELDFVVENKTGKTLLICCFVYQKKEDMPVWNYDKTPIIKLKPNQSGTIDVDTLSNQTNRDFAQGFLGVFDENKKEEAENSTYELLSSQNKLILGQLTNLKNKKIVLEIEKYGLEGNFLEFSIK